MFLHNSVLYIDHNQISKTCVLKQFVLCAKYNDVKLDRSYFGGMLMKAVLCRPMLRCYWLLRSY